MHKRHAIVLLLFCLGWAALAGAQESPRWEIHAEQGVNMNFETGLVTTTNGISVKYADSLLTARNATLNQRTGEITAEGDVRLERQGVVWLGKSLQYNFITGKVIARNFKTGQPPFFVGAEAVVGDTKAGIYAAANGMLTTDDVAKPGYSIRAKSIVVVPGEYIMARNAVLYLGKVPVFWFPYYRRSLVRHPNYWTLVPGYRSRDGAYLLSAYNWYWSERLDGAMHLDGRWKRGVGVGPDFNWHLPRFGEGQFKYYYLHDLEPGMTTTDRPIKEDRQRVWFSHQVAINSNLTAKAMVRWQSDPMIVRDFFESEYQENPQPSTYLEVNQQWTNFTLNLLAQPRVNRFFETVEQLPDLRLSGLRQQLGRTPLYYDSESSLGWYRRKFAENETNNYSALRADTFHQVLLPHTFFGWLNVTPRVGGRFTHYGESDPYGRALSERDRGVFNTGVEMTFKASRVWPDVRSRFWQLDGLRHIIEPGINYAYVPRPNRTPDELPQFQFELPTTRLLPIMYPAYNAIDSIDSQNVLRLSLRNLLQTKRQGRIEDFLHWAVVTDWRLKPRADQSTFSDLYSQMDLQPFSWVTLSSDLRIGLDNPRVREANHGLTLAPNSHWSVNFSHRYLETDLATGLGTGNNLFSSTLYYRLNENWGTRAYWRYEARDKVLEEQQYTLYRDFRSWTGALTLRVRDNRNGPTDFTVAVTFSLKAFPRFDLGEDVNHPSRLLGY